MRTLNINGLSEFTALPRCGDCAKWMKKPDCPKERGVMNAGPSAMQLACSEYEPSKQVWPPRSPVTKGNE